MFEITNAMAEAAAEALYGPGPHYRFKIVDDDLVPYEVPWNELGNVLGGAERTNYLNQARRALVAGLGAQEPMDPTARPDPRHWGVELRSGRRQRVYWDASLAARHENAWTNIARTERFSADVVQADKDTGSSR